MAPFPGMRFAARPIDRAATLGIRKDPQRVRKILESSQARFVLVHLKKDRAVLTTAGKPPQLAWWTRRQLLQLSDKADSEAIYLGPLLEGGPPLAPDTPGPVEAFAVDVSAFWSADAAQPEAEVWNREALQSPSKGVAAVAEKQEQVWKSGRDFALSKSSDAEVVIAGLALALAGWSDKARFDGGSGRPTELVEGGTKRQEIGGRGRAYPRTDPVAIGLIVSPDGQKILLHTRTDVGGVPMYTCLSGFVDQCETIEDALRREAWEEAGCRVGRVDLMCSQGWPIGRAGSCELMVACRAVAESEKIQANYEEVNDARWFSREEVRLMLSRTHPEGFFVPPPFAIAFHMITQWVEGTQGDAGFGDGRRDSVGLVGSVAVAGAIGVLAGFGLAHLRHKL